MGRELSRREDVNGATGTTSTRTYNALGQLATSRDSTPAKPGIPATPPTTHTFTVDALGNQISAVTTNGFVNTSEVRATHGTADRDRLCRLDYGPSTTGPCNVAHDGSGNIRSYPARGGATRTLTYYPSGGIRYIQQGSVTANIRSDGSGEIEALDVTGTGAIDPRTDRRYGLTQQRVINGQTVLIRSIPGAGGIVATKRGATGPWIYGLSDQQGTRGPPMTGPTSRRRSSTARSASQRPPARSRTPSSTSSTSGTVATPSPTSVSFASAPGSTTALARFLSATRLSFRARRRA